MEHTFQPLLFGGDINVYSVARAFHEAYGVKSICFGKFASGPAYGSSIIDYRVCPQNEDGETFRQNVAAVAEEPLLIQLLLSGPAGRAAMAVTELLSWCTTAGRDCLTP